MFEVSKAKYGTRLAYFSLLFPIVFTLSCGTQTPTVGDVNGDAAIIDIANNDLTNSDCADALTDILPLYNSSFSSNQARLVTASAYGCDAEINFFTVLTNMGLDANTLTSASMLGFFAQLFPSTSQDQVLASAGYGMEVLMTALIPGQVVSPANSINATSNNPGSLLSTDRIADSNLYMLLMSMSALGAAASRNAGSNFHPANASTPFPWINNTTAMTTDGCTVAAAAVDFFDVFADEVAILSGIPSQLSIIESQFDASTFNLACQYGCTGAVPSGADAALLNPLGHWQATGCTLANCGNGSSCPMAVRDWTQCKVNTSNDPIGCADAGIINFLNNGALWM
jgi:hypothetical protein